MTDISAAPGNGAAKPAERRIRHGLIEDWRDALGILILLLVAALLGAVIAVYFFTGEDAASTLSPDTAARLSALEAHSAPRDLANLKDRIAKLETRLRVAEAGGAAVKGGGDLAAAAIGALGANSSPALDAAKKQIDDLSGRLAALEAKLVAAPEEIKNLTSKLGDIADRLMKIEGSDLLEMARRAAFATAVANLTRAAEGSAPFKREFDVVAGLSPHDARLPELAQIASKGLPTASTLMTTFGDQAARALNAERVAQAKGWLEHLWANFTTLISSRVVGEVGDDTNEGRLARAEQRLKSGDLSGAMRELNAVKGPAREPLKPWLAAAEARIRLEAALADLNARAVQALTAPSLNDASEPVPQLPTP